jgi:hypothetical protein
LLVEL